MPFLNDTEDNEVVDIRDLYPLCFQRIEKEQSFDQQQLNELMIKIRRGSVRKNIDDISSPMRSMTRSEKEKIDEDENAHDIVMAFVAGDSYCEEKPIRDKLLTAMKDTKKRLSINRGAYKIKKPSKLDPRATTALKNVMVMKGWKTHHVVLLLEKGANPNVTLNTDLETPLHICVQTLDFITLKYLITVGANINYINREGRSPIMSLCANTKENSFQSSSTSICQYLLQQKKIDINIRDNYGKNVLIYAIENLHLNLIRELILYGVDVTNKEDDNLSLSPYETALLIYAKTLRIDLNSIHNKIKYLEKDIYLPRGASSDLTYMSYQKIYISLLYKTKTEVMFSIIHHKKLLEDQYNKRAARTSPTVASITSSSRGMSRAISHRRNQLNKGQKQNEKDRDNSRSGSENSGSAENNNDTGELSERQKRKYARLLAARLQREEETQRQWVRKRQEAVSQVNKEYPGTLGTKKQENQQVYERESPLKQLRGLEKSSEKREKSTRQRASISEVEIIEGSERQFQDQIAPSPQRTRTTRASPTRTGSETFSRPKRHNCDKAYHSDRNMNMDHGPVPVPAPVPAKDLLSLLPTKKHTQSN